MITADTITDDQIKELRGELITEIARLASTPEAWTMPLDKALQEAAWALSQGFADDALQDRKRAARIRCAEILNARNQVPSL